MKATALGRTASLVGLLLAVASCSGGPVTPHDDGGVDTTVAADGVGADHVGGDGTTMCASDAQCDDGMYCDGTERCAPGTAGADARGCVHGAAPCTASQLCTEATHACISMMCTHAGMPDMDGDGHADIACGGDDCDDGDAHRFPGNPEVCLSTMASDGDGGTMLTRTNAAVGLDPTHDEDCDPTTFASATTGDGDHDGDGYVDHDCANRDRSGMSNRGADCDDLLTEIGVPASLMTSVMPGNIHPMQPEVCDGVDNNCNGVVDEGEHLNFYPDCDGDNYGSPAAPAMVGCNAMQFAQCNGHNAVQNNTDCNDAAASINPGTPEVCDVAMVDENCNGLHNEGCMCVADVPCGLALPGCPSGIEPCVAGHLQSCSVMPTVLTCYVDADSDGYAPMGAASSMACACPVHTTTRAPIDGTTIDCDDGHTAIHPGATEVCNSVDDNCVGGIDEGFPTSTFYLDADGDGYGTTALVTCLSRPSGYANAGGDCDDGDANAKPGQTGWFTSPRATRGGFDFNCDGSDQGEPFNCAANTTPATCVGHGSWRFSRACGAMSAAIQCRWNFMTSSCDESGLPLDGLVPCH